MSHGTQWGQCVKDEATDQQTRNRSHGMPTFPKVSIDGCWVAYKYDWHKLVKAVFLDELSARQWAMANYCEVQYAEWGQELQ